MATVAEFPEAFKRQIQRAGCEWEIGSLRERMGVAWGGAGLWWAWIGRGLDYEATS